ncbi:MAG: hypothetical protein K8T91_18810 [Planctomycetes bacterium]|nr:hypothetical protein [Planctomycetota bacterium]
MKRPLKYQLIYFQWQLLRDGSRDEIIEWLCWNDPNGCYTDKDSSAEGYPPLTRERAQAIMRRQVARDSRFVTLLIGPSL